jgi:NadR type nicotinamide-nucleotide adenylyltransferase
MLKRIAVTGPESTGKSMLSEQLARHFNTVWVPEFAREYLGNLGREYGEADLLSIAKGQLELESRIAPDAKGFLFCDTELTVIKIWSEVRYGRCDPWILKHLGVQQFDLYLLCDIDLPWEYDPLREHPDRRQFLFDRYRKELTGLGFPFEIVSGTGPARVECALKAIGRSDF